MAFPGSLRLSGPMMAACMGVMLAAPALATPAPQTAALSPGQVTQLCNAVSDQILSRRGVQFDLEHGDEGLFPPRGAGMYMYEEMFHTAAGVAPDDGPDQVREKIQRFWLNNREHLSCQQLGFSIRGGNVAKLAFERSSNHVINDFIRRWDLDLNFIDPADGKSVLDYVEGELEKSGGTSAEPVWRRYRDLLVRSGAMHGADL